MKKKLVLLSTITALMMGQSAIGFAVTNETPNVEIGKATQTFEITQENEEQQLNNQREATKEHEKLNPNQQQSNESLQEETNTSEVKDEKAPALHSLKVDKKEVSSGESVKISVDVKDESGVKYVSVLYRNTGLDNGQKSTDTKEVNLEYNAENKVYEGVFVVSEDTTAGTWDMDTISVSDNLGNETILSPQSIENKDASFVVKKDSKGDKSDVIPPTIGEVIVDKKADPLGVGDIINFSVEATDDQSGIEYVTIVCYTENEITGRISYHDTDLMYNETSKRYEGKFEIKEYTEMGVWNIQISALDKAENQTYQDLNISFTVVGTTLDKVAPVIEDVKIIADKEVINGGKVKVNATISDDFSGVSSAQAWLVNEEALQRIMDANKPGEVVGEAPPEVAQIVDLYSVNGSHLFEGTITVTEEMERGEWSLIRVTASDNAHNYAGMEDKYEGLSFVVADEKTPPTPEPEPTPNPEPTPGKPEQPRKPEQPTNPEQPTKPQQPATQSPQTGDTSNVPLYGAALLVSVLGLGVLVRRKKQR